MRAAKDIKRNNLKYFFKFKIPKFLVKINIITITANIDVEADLTTKKIKAKLKNKYPNSNLLRSIKRSFLLNK